MFCLNAGELQQRQSLLSVGLALALMLLAPCAVQQLGSLRAAQNETNENRSEFEVNERFHASVQPTRRAAKNRGLRHAMYQILPTSPQQLTSLRRVAAECQLFVADVVSWSPSMRC
jgi:hypothetical protein